MAQYYPTVIADDANWFGTSFVNAPNTIIMGDGGGYNYRSSIRFPSIVIDQGATIATAKLTFTTNNAYALTDCNVRIYGNKTEDAVAPTTAAEGNALSLTTEFVDWTVPVLSGADETFDSPDISDIVKEIIDQVGWESMNAVQLVIYNNSSTNQAYRRYYSLKGSAEKSSCLTVTEPPPPATITGNISVVPRMYPQLVRGFAGDTVGHLVISPRLNAMIVASPAMEGHLGITPRLHMQITANIYTAPGLNVTRPMLTFQGKGIVSAIGTLNVTRPSRVAGFVGNDNPLGILNIIRPARSFYSSGTTGVIGILNIARPSRLFKGTFRQNETAILDITRPRRSISLTGAVGAVGTLNVSIPMRRLSFSGILSAEGVLSVSRPMRQALLWTLPTTYACMVMNLKNKGLTEYSNYVFNSMCRFNGVHLGATKAGIYNLDSGDTDAGSIIDWNFRTGYLDMIETGVNPALKKRAKQAWLSYKSSGDIMLTIIQPDGESYEYDLTGYEVYETGLRVKFGKGFRTRYLAFDVSNIDGSSITLDALKLQFDKVLKER